MRDSVTADDLAIEGAKAKLEELRSRPGYAEAMAPRPTSATGKVAILVVTGALGVLTVSMFIIIDIAWKRWLAGIAFALMTLLMAFLTLGMWLPVQRKGWGAAVLAKRLDDKKPLVTLLRDDGQQVEAVATQATYDLLRPGDLGVAWIDAGLTPPTLESFTRL